MWFIGIWLALFALVFVLPLFWLVPRWGAPYPTAYRRRRGGRYSATDVTDLDVPVDSGHDQTAPGVGAGSNPTWGYWADALWLAVLALVAALVIWAVM